MNCSSAKSPLGLLKVLLTALLVTIALLSYYGNEGERLLFGLADYLGVGITVGFCLVIPLIFITYLCDGNILIFECFISLTGSILFMAVAVLTYSSYSHPDLGAPAGRILSGLSAAVSLLLLTNLVVVGLTLRK